jgi:hypothetical protein
MLHQANDEVFPPGLWPGARPGLHASVARAATPVCLPHAATRVSRPCAAAVRRGSPLGYFTIVCLLDGPREFLDEPSPEISLAC